MNKNDIVNLEIISITSEGHGVAKDGEYVYFVPYAIMGETVSVRILKIKKNIVYCRLLEVLIPSPFRREPECADFFKCGGCSLLNIDYNKQLEMKLQKVNDAIRRIGKIDYNVSKIIPSDKTYGYRNKALIPVSEDKEGNIICGFYRTRTHDVINMNECQIQDPDAFRVVYAVRKWMEEYKIKPYNEKDGTGFVRHIFFRKGIHTAEIMAGIVTFNKKTPHIDKLKNIIIENVPEVTSVIVNINNKKTNVILGDEILTLHGEKYITDKILNKTFKIGSLSFFQVNPYNVGNLYQAAIDMLSPEKDDVLFDIYCGIGTIGICASHKVKEVIGVEIIPEAIELAKENAKINNADNCTFYTGKAEEIIFKLIENNNRPTAVILDPPRSGCDKTLIDEIIKLKPEKICYVSCDVATLARDLNIFKESGQYNINEIIACDMFPNTPHVECCVLLCRTY